jgi:stage II sporulation protein D
MKDSYSKIQQAVKETKGHIITYNNKPILTLYFSTSSGKTENSEEVFSTAYPYLKSVESPYDKDYSPKYVSTLKISNKDFVNALQKSYSDIQLDEDNLSNQIKILETSDGGSVEKIKIGNKEIKGINVRSILNLNSANFDIDFKDNYLDFIVKGYGHGVGMSQWGAEGMAKEGYKYYDILSHYYAGTQITDLY